MSLPVHIKYDRRVDDLLEAIIERYPSAGNFHPCPCGVTVAVIPSHWADPAIHFIILDTGLRNSVRIELKARKLPMSACDDDDAVLVLTELA